MRKILFSLTILFATSITGCLDDAQQPEPDQKVLTAEQHPEKSDQAPSDQAVRNDLSDLPDQPVAIQQELDEGGAANTKPDDNDPMFCNTVADCEEGYWCRIDTNRCIPAKH
jgi:hypothetical protein